MKRTALGLLVVGIAATLLVSPWSDAPYTDLPIYAGYADEMLGGGLPYRDFAFEYPPLAAPLLALPGLVGTGGEEYRLAFAALALGLGGAVVLLTGALAGLTGGDRRVALLMTAAMPLLLGAIVRSRFDLAPVALTLGALVLLCGGRPRLGFAVLGAGVLMKAFPLVVAPVALAWLLARGERRAALEGGAVLAATVVSVVAVAYAISPEGTGDAVRYHLDRPVQVESSPASVVLAIDAPGAGEARVEESFGSNGIRHPADDAVTALFAVLLVAVVALLAMSATLSRDGPPGPRSLVLAALAAVAAFAAFGKVLSPQFLIWVVPLAALAFSWRMHALGAALGLAVVLTAIEFPARYGDVVQLDAGALLLVGVRNALLIAAVGLAARELLASPAPARGSAGWRLRGRPRRPRPAPR